MVINIILNKLMWLVCTCLLAPIRYHLNTTTTDINSNKKYFEQSNVTGLHLPTITFLIQLLLIWTAINYLEQANVTGMHLPAITLIQQPLILMSIKIILNKLMWLACTPLILMLIKIILNTERQLFWVRLISSDLAVANYLLYHSSPACCVVSENQRSQCILIRLLVSYCYFIC